eukprot:g7976.t1
MSKTTPITSLLVWLKLLTPSTDLSSCDHCLQWIWGRPLAREKAEIETEGRMVAVVADEERSRDRVVPPQIPAGPQEWQVMCAACGTLCGSSHRFCSFCGNFLHDGIAGPVMMAYFQPPDWQMMDSQQSAQTPESQKPKTPKSETSIKEKNNKMPQEPAQEATEEREQRSFAETH